MLIKRLAEIHIIINSVLVHQKNQKTPKPKNLMNFKLEKHLSQIILSKEDLHQHILILYNQLQTILLSLAQSVKT